MGATFTRVEDINDKVHDLSLTITQWRVLFAVNEATSVETIKEMVNEGEDEILAAAAKLVESGLLSQEGELPASAAPETAVESAPEPEPVAEPVVEATPEPEPQAEPEVVPEPEPEIVPEPELEAPVEAEPEAPVEEDIDMSIESDIEISEDDSDDSSEDETSFENLTDEIIEPEIEASPEVAEVEAEPVAEPEPEPTPEPVAEAEAPAAASGSGGKIYVVDDSIVIRKMVELALEDTGIEVIGFSSGKDAIDNMNNDKPGLAIIDVGLPDISGIEIMKKIKSSLNIPVLIFSNKNTPADEDSLSSEGADGFMPKPFRDDVLLSMVTEKLN